MALNFPNSPTNGQIYENYIYNATVGTWQLVSIDNIYTGAVIDTTPPGSPVAGDMWWDSDDGKLFIYYNDGTSSQWVNASGPSVAVQDTAPAGYEGQLWLDSTDGSMYVYYTDPGGTNSQWIGAVSNNNTAGNVIQVVSVTKTDTYSVSIGAGAFDTQNVPTLDVSITPTSTASKILVSGTISIFGDTRPNYKLMRDGSDVTGAIGDADGSRARLTSGQFAGQNEQAGAASFEYLDSPSTTSAVTYGVRMHNGVATTKTIYVNRGVSGTDNSQIGRYISTITLWEVAG